jgi:hypothetical protein
VENLLTARLLTKLLPIYALQSKYCVSKDLRSVLQDLIPQVILSETCPVDTHLIRSGYEAMSI